MAKRMTILALCLLLTIGLLAGCKPSGGQGTQAIAPTNTPVPADEVEVTKQPQQQSGTLSITINNATSVTFNELYISPTASNDWGTDHLGSTNILKSNGSFDVSLAKYEFENYDIRVVDADSDTYTFKYVPLVNGASVEIYYTDMAGYVADIVNPDGSTTQVENELDSDPDPNDVIPDYTKKTFEFTVFNESAYQINYIYMEPAYAEGEPTDILPSVLPGGENYTYRGQFPGGTDILEWRLYVVDEDGDTSASYDVFDPWSLDYVDIAWDNSAQGYVCYFYHN